MKSKTKKSIIIQTVVVFSLCFILLIFITFQFVKIWDLKNTQYDISNKISQLQQENAQYSDELDYYNSYDYLEDQAHMQNKHDVNKTYY